MRTRPSGAWGLLALVLALPLASAQEPPSPGSQPPAHLVERAGYLEAQLEPPERESAHGVDASAPSMHPADDVEALQLELLRLADELDQVWHLVHEQEPEGELGAFALAVQRELRRRDQLEAIDQAEIVRLRQLTDDLGAKFAIYHQLAEDNAAQAERLHQLFTREQRARRWDIFGCAVGIGAAGDSEGTTAGFAAACGLKF